MRYVVYINISSFLIMSYAAVNRYSQICKMVYANLSESVNQAIYILSSPDGRDDSIEYGMRKAKNFTLKLSVRRVAKDIVSLTETTIPERSYNFEGTADGMGNQVHAMRGSMNPERFSIAGSTAGGAATLTGTMEGRAVNIGGTTTDTINLEIKGEGKIQEANVRSVTTTKDQNIVYGVVAYAIVYWPEMVGERTEQNVPRLCDLPTTIDDLYNPSQNIIMEGLVNTDGDVVVDFSELSRNMYSGDMILLLLKYYGARDVINVVGTVKYVMSYC